MIWFLSSRIIHQINLSFQGNWSVSECYLYAIFHGRTIKNFVFENPGLIWAISASWSIAIITAVYSITLWKRWRKHSMEQHMSQDKEWNWSSWKACWKKSTYVYFQRPVSALNFTFRKMEGHTYLHEEKARERILYSPLSIRIHSIHCSGTSWI